MHVIESDCVAVLLATFNGQDFLNLQLDSIRDQEECIHLFIRDDGSTDSTVSMIKARTDLKIESFIIGTNIGSRNSFYELLMQPELSEFNYISLCDQDDIWEHSKIGNAREHLARNQNTVLYCSKRKILNKSQLRTEKFPMRSQILNSLSLVFENKCYGNTLVIKKDLVDFMRKHKLFSSFTPHDWWIGRIGLCLGDVYLASDSQIIYRLHNHNEVGISNNAKLFAFRISRSRNIRKFYFLNEYIELLSRIEEIKKIQSDTRKFILAIESGHKTKNDFSQLRLSPIENFVFILFMKIRLIPHRHNQFKQR